MPSEDGAREKVGRKLTKRPKYQRRVSLDFPERFKDGDDEADDVTAPRSSMSKTMNQSLMTLIAKAGSRPDLHALLEEESSDSDEDTRSRKAGQSLDGADAVTDARGNQSAEKAPKLAEDVKARSHRRRISEHKLLRSLPKLSMKSRKERKDDSDPMSASQILSPRQSKETSPSRRATSRTDPLADRSLPSSPKVGALSPGIPSRLKATANLAQRLKEIFEFEKIEEVISEYRCWLLQSVLLQGYMYITQKHICFYAYLPKQHNEVAKTGYLYKRGRSKYNRYWFILKGDILAYYTNPADLYFPRNRIDLHYGISASVAESKDKTKESTSFTVVTDQRTYQFKADSVASAQEWARAIQKVIFRTHNDGNSVKISLPIQNILDVEENPMIDYAETVKIRVIDNDETYAIDEYFFSFFNLGEDALNVLRIMVNSNDDLKLPPADTEGRQDDQSPRRSMALEGSPRLSMDGAAPVLREHVRATLSPLPPGIRGHSPAGSPRSSLDHRRSLDASRTFRRVSSDGRGRRSLSEHRSRSFTARRGDKSPLSPKLQGSSASVSNSNDPGTESSAAVQSIDDTSASASQILARSDVFQRPTITHSQTTSDRSIDKLGRRSQETARSVTTSKIPTGSPGIPKKKRGTAPQGSFKPEDVVGAEDSISERPPMGRSGSSSALHGLMNAPLQKASGIAGFLKSRSKRMSNLLATESMGYYEKVSGMWAGGRKHYNVAEGLQPNDQVSQEEDQEDALIDAERFREHFALPDSEKLMATFFGHLQRVLPIYGKIYVSDRHFCFRSLMPTTRTKLILPLKDIENVNKENGFRLHFSGLCIVIRGHEELFFEFTKSDVRDDCAVTLHRMIESVKYIEDSDSLKQEDLSIDEAAKAEHDLLQKARVDAHVNDLQPATDVVHETEPGRIPLIFDDPHASIVDFKPSASLRITCLTIGSRGDVQPYIALCKGLLAEGHRPRIATHKEFEHWVRRHGIDFAPVEGDPAELMRICVENGMFTMSFMLEATSKFRDWLDELLASAFEACKGSDVLIESPSAMAGIHIAEALEVPYFRAFTMPWTRTRAYPHAFAVPEHKLGGGYNALSYVAFDAFFWAGISGQINRWRRQTLGLPSTSPAKMQPNARPFLYNFSPSVVIPPLDWPDWIRVTGYWFLDESQDWKPPQELLDFIKKARDDDKKLIYVGFGSIVVDDPAKLTKTVVDAVQKADVRCILSKGWSDRLNHKDESKPELPLPSYIHQIQSAPHDWLFNQVDAVVHHGGAGTTGASLRAGIPTVIKPFFGDQYFFGSRVEDLGVGICLIKMNTSILSRAMWEAVHSQRMIIKAKILGEKIRKENGVQTAIQTIYRELDRAKSFVKKRDHKAVEEEEGGFDEDWTMVDQEEELDSSQLDMTKWQPVTHMGQASAAGHGGSSSMALGGMVLKGAGSAKGKGKHI